MESNALRDSPHYAKSNGHAESDAKAIKHLVTFDRNEFCEGLLEWLNTSKTTGLSPVKILYGLQLRSILPFKFTTCRTTWKTKYDNLY